MRKTVGGSNAAKRYLRVARFHGLLELAVFGLAKKTGNVQKDDEAPLELADSRHIIGFIVRKNGAGASISEGGISALRGGADDQADELVLSSTTRMRFFLSGWW